MTQTEPAALLTQLEHLGFDADSLARLRREVLARGERHPFAADPARVRQVGFARYQAALAGVLQAAGLDGTHSAAPAARRPPNADERRLLADRPPHWG